MKIRRISELFCNPPRFWTALFVSENCSFNTLIIKYKCPFAELDLHLYPPSRRLQVRPSDINVGIQGEKGSYPAIA